MIRQYLRTKVDQWKKAENSKLAQLAYELSGQAALNVAELVSEPHQKQVARIATSNKEFYIQVARHERAEDLSFVECLKYDLYSCLDRIL